MRLNEFVAEDIGGNQYSNVATALSLLQNRVRDGKLKPEIPTEMVLRFIRNTGLNSFVYQDLLAANEAEPSLKNILKNITPDTVTVATDVSQSADNPQDITSVVGSPEQTVSNMATKAVKRRQKPLF